MFEKAKFLRPTKAMSVFATLVRQQARSDIWADAGHAIELAIAVRPGRQMLRTGNSLPTRQHRGWER